ncbi:MAG: hypothetical protein HN509_16925 [Halobacteriovoraceae bacterium]|nr:hypothetical protein [Halobacteriovoraceae bacterium]MBT5093162.1 hypothetical protein [Halobacteriovoraceae bacterium]
MILTVLPILGNTSTFKSQLGTRKVPTAMLVWQVNSLFENKELLPQFNSEAASLISEGLLLEDPSKADSESGYRQKLEIFIEKVLSKLRKSHKTIDREDKLFKSWQRESFSKGLRSRKARAGEIPFSIYFFNHIHSKYSKDNKELKLLKYSPEKIAKLANKFVKKRKSQGSMTFNDHGHVGAYDDVKDKKYSHMSFLRGVEWGGRSHMNLMGVVDNWNNLPNGRQFAYEEIVQEAASSEAVRIANHPAGEGNYWPIDRWSDLEAIEVWNSVMEERPFKFVKFLPISNNRTALKLWNDDLKLGNKRTALGGTDFHFHIPCATERAMFFPANIIAIPHNEPYNVKKEVKRGNVSIITRPTSPKLFLSASTGSETSYKEFGMGGNISGQGIAKIKLVADYSSSRKRLKGLCYNAVGGFFKSLSLFKKETWELRFYNTKSEQPFLKVKLPKKSKTGEVVEFDYPIKAGEKDFVRAELWVVNKKLKLIEHLALTNPVTFNY